MDTRYLGNNLLTIGRYPADRGRIWTRVEEEAYYRQHAPAQQSRIPTVGLAVAGIAIGIASLGIWPS